jgi:hypothetical protein
MNKKPETSRSQKYGGADLPVIFCLHRSASLKRSRKELENFSGFSKKTAALSLNFENFSDLFFLATMVTGQKVKWVKPLPLQCYLSKSFIFEKIWQRNIWQRNAEKVCGLIPLPLIPLPLPDFAFSFIPAKKSR